jgi:predicted CopG family antitoxin
MNLNHLTDEELIQYIIKHDDDPVRIRLAKVMDNMPGFILRRLEDVGMNPETCMFENNYDPGDWIRHLENEIEYLNRELNSTQLKLEERETLSVSELIEELLQNNRRLEIRAQQSDADRRKAQEENERTQKKMKVWRAISTDVS